MTVTPSRPARLGHQHSYKLNPPPGNGCKVTWKIDNQPVTVGSEVGGLKVNGLNGTLTVTAVGGIAGTVVSASVVCGGVQQGPVESHVHREMLVQKYDWRRFWRTIFDAIGKLFKKR